MTGFVLRTRQVVAPLGQRNFRLLWFGRAVSALGDPLQAIALAWLVLDMTGSAVALSGALLATALPRAGLTLLGGVVTDRRDPRIVMFWSDVIRAFTVGAIALLAFTGNLSLWFLYGLLAIQGAASGMFSPAAYSITPRLVSTENLQAANALGEMTPQFGMLIAAPLGGAIVVLTGAAPALALNAASFAFAALAVLLIQPMLDYTPNETKRSLFSDVQAGLAYIRGQSWLVVLLVVDTILDFAAAGPLAIGLPLLARNVVDGGPQVLGLMIAGFGGGSIVGMLLLAAHTSVRRRGRTFCLFQLAQAPLLAAIPFVPLALTVGLLTVIGLLNSISVVVYLGLIQTRVAPDMLGRVMSVVALAAFGLTPFAQMVAGAIAQTTSPALIFLLGGMLLFLASVGGLLTPALRTVD
jgi:DHA3 family tetracycline resistance protein-like MFS transporter